MKTSASMSSPVGPSARFCLVVGLKFDDGGAYAVEEAVRIAQRIPRGLVHIVHVESDPMTPPARRELVEHLRLYANEKVKSLGGCQGMTLGIHVRSGDASSELVRFARDVGADLMIVGAENHHRIGWYRRPIVERLLESASCPVVVAGPKPRPHAEAATEPVIEPPCEACVATRAASNGASWWCVQHAGHAAQAHTFSYQRELPLRSTDTLVFPAGIEM